jgi:hypothetical protein
MHGQFQSDQGSALCRRGWHADTTPEGVTLLTFFGPPQPSTTYAMLGDDPRIRWVECKAAACGRSPGPVDLWYIHVIGMPGSRWATSFSKQEIEGTAADAKREAECSMRDLGWGDLVSEENGSVRAGTIAAASPNEE